MTSSSRGWRPWSGILIAAVALSLRPMEIGPSDWPVERFVRNLEARLRDAPEDPGAHYTLGRVHAFAFALERSSLFGGGDEELHRTYLKDIGDQIQTPSSPAPPPDEALRHLSEGLVHLQRAVTLEGSPLHLLTLAWLLETGAHLADRVDTPRLLGLADRELAVDERTRIEIAIAELGAESEPTFERARAWLADPERLEPAVPVLARHTATAQPRRQAAVAALLRAAWIERSIDVYRRCLERAEAEGLLEDPMILGPVAVALPREALLAYRRLVRARGVRDAEEERRLARADAQLAALEAKPPVRWITPLVLSLADCPTLETAVLPDARVPFDLDGDGTDELWPWPAPDSGWLVWDPARKGQILSGCQLFGSASGWLFFQDGYRVLDALDDDRDGRLRGAELEGLALWRDRDTDGVSDRGEVVPLEQLGVVALACAATAALGPTLTNPCGLELADGRVLPTWDWMLENPTGQP